MAVRLLASIPAVTCSAVEADPNPLRPALPVISEKIPISLNRPKEKTEPYPFVAPVLFDHMRDRQREIPFSFL